MAKDWRLAKSLVVLLDQCNRKWPGRSKASDGTIGDAAHRHRPSDHNPDENGTVNALDVTHDPRSGLDSEQLAQALVRSKDRRIKYIISNKKICSGEGQSQPAWKWRPYSGANAHDHHVHVSVRKQFEDDTTPWELSGVMSPQTNNFVAPPPLVKIGSRGNAVMEVQKLLDLELKDGIFGPRTYAAVQHFQSAHGLVTDGIVGPATWAKLKEKKDA